MVLSNWYNLSSAIRIKFREILQTSWNSTHLCVTFLYGINFRAAAVTTTSWSMSAQRTRTQKEDEIPLCVLPLTSSVLSCWTAQVCALFALKTPKLLQRENIFVVEKVWNSTFPDGTRHDMGHCCVEAPLIFTVGWARRGLNTVCSDKWKRTTQKQDAPVVVYHTRLFWPRLLHFVWPFHLKVQRLTEGQNTWIQCPACPGSSKARLPTFLEIVKARSTSSQRAISIQPL